MGTALRPIGHEDRLSLVDHLSELRRRLIICVVTLLAAFSVCFWQNHAILKIITKPVRDAQNVKNPSATSKDPDVQAARFQQEQVRALRSLSPALASSARTFDALGAAGNLTATQRTAIGTASRQLALASRQAALAAKAAPTNAQAKLVTLSVTEPFTSTITIAFYAALLLAMPMLLFQAYAFVLPAFSPRERKVALPLMLMVPVLFIAGVAFGYFVVLDRAVQFLQNFNSESFDNLLQANTYFKFAVLFVAGVGLLFQIPVGVLAITRLGIFTPRQIAKNRGYVILGISILAAVATPTPDPVTMTLAMAPLIILFELSILLARWIDRIKPAVDEDDEDDDADPQAPDDGDPPGGHDAPGEDPYGHLDPDDDEAAAVAAAADLVAAAVADDDQRARDAYDEGGIADEDPSADDADPPKLQDPDWKD
ncbi:MAG: sec-independent protein translocase protein TatC [Solirubrobacteraceae bacterium]|jgi:sec-independent protein translocase protein TatC|nr:sec-independent protein translocase protein TatC [Solirubrobacteraceae bacterium]